MSREFLDELVARVEASTVVLAGFSTGADIALRLAATPDPEMYRGLVRELQLRNLDEGLLGDRYEEGSVITEADTSHVDLLEPGRVARHLEALVSRLGTGAS